MLWLQAYLCYWFGHRWIGDGVGQRRCDHCQREEYLNGRLEWRSVSERPLAPSA